MTQFNGLTTQRLAAFGVAIFLVGFCGGARAQILSPDKNSTRSRSDQFIVQGTPQISLLARSPRIAADTNLVRLEPALLVVSAENIKEWLGRTLEIKASTPWRGQVYFALRPALSPDDGMTIISQPFSRVWSYRVELPDVLPRLNFARAMVQVLLLEYANRGAQSHSAEIPVWLTDGLSRQLLAPGSPETILSVPSKSEIMLAIPSKSSDNLSVSRLTQNMRGMDPLADSRRVLKNSPALTFEQLSWPTEAQLNGDDDGVYRASSQLFLSELLKLKDGPARLRAMLETLPRFYNWQLAFQSAFRDIFPRPLDLEKWWALQVVSFISLDPGPGWTLAVSKQKLEEILSVPVETRTATNSLPLHAEVSLQTVIRNFDPARQDVIFQTRLRDLELAQLRISPKLAALTEGYRRAVADYLGQPSAAAPRPNWVKRVLTGGRTSASQTIKTLDALDAQRRTLEATLQPEKSVQPSLEMKKFD